MLTISKLPFLVEQRVCGVEILDLPCLASGKNPNLTSDDMADLRRQGIAVNDNNNPDPKTIPAPENSLSKTGRGLQLEKGRNHIPEAIKQFTQHLCCFQ